MKNLIQIAGVIDKQEAAMLVDACVDAHTGLENTNGRKDPDLIKRFVAKA